MIEYLTYLVKVKKAYKSITLNFLLSGHTKFTTDGNFGRAKSHIKKHDTQSILSLVGKDGLIQTSARNNYEISYKDPHSEFCFLWLEKLFRREILAVYGIQRRWIVTRGIFSFRMNLMAFWEQLLIIKDVIFEEFSEAMVPEGCKCQTSWSRFL